MNRNLIGAGCGHTAVEQAGACIQREPGRQPVGGVSRWGIRGDDGLPEINTLILIEGVCGDDRRRGSGGDDDLVDPARVLPLGHGLVLDVVDVHIVRAGADIGCRFFPVDLATNVILHDAVHGQDEVVVVLFRGNFPLKFQSCRSVHGELHAGVFTVIDCGGLHGRHAVIGGGGFSVGVSVAERHDLEAFGLVYRVGQGRGGRQDVEISKVTGGASGVGGALPAFIQAGYLRGACDQPGGGVERKACWQRAGVIGSSIKAGGKIGGSDLLVHRPAFAASDDPVGGDDRQRQSCVRGCAVEGDGGGVERAHIAHHLVDHLQFPVAHGAFAPAMRGREGPVQIRAGVIKARAGQPHGDAAGGDEAPFQITPIGVGGIDVHGDVFHSKVVRHRHREGLGNTVGIKVRNGEVQGRGRVAFGLHGSQVGPGRGEVDGLLGIHQASAIFDVEVESCAIGHPVAIIIVILRGAAHQDFLHIAGGQVWVCLQHEGHDTCHRGGGRGGAAKGVRVVGVAVVRRLDGAPILVVTEGAGAVRGGDALLAAVGWGADENVGPGFAVIGCPAQVVHGGNGDGINGIGPAIVVGIIPVQVAIPGRPEKNGAQSATACRGGGGQCLGAQSLRAGIPKRAVIGAPAVAFGGDDVGLVGVGVRLLLVGGGGGDQAQAHECGFRCHAGATQAVVAFGCRHACAGGSVKVRRPGRGIAVVVIEIIAAGQIHIGRQVRVGHFQSVVHDGYANAGAFVGVPHARHIHIRACGGTVLASVLQVPLVARIGGIVGKVGVVRDEAVEELMSQHGLRRDDPRGLEQAGRTGDRRIGVSGKFHDGILPTHRSLRDSRHLSQRRRLGAGGQFHENALGQPAACPIVFRRTFLVQHPLAFGAGFRQGALKLPAADQDLRMQEAAGSQQNEENQGTHLGGDK